MLIPVLKKSAFPGNIKDDFSKPIEKEKAIIIPIIIILIPLEAFLQDVPRKFYGLKGKIFKTGNHSNPEDESEYFINFSFLYGVRGNEIFPRAEFSKKNLSLKPIILI